jgi:hypothetical protein
MPGWNTSIILAGLFPGNEHIALNVFESVTAITGLNHHLCRHTPQIPSGPFDILAGADPQTYELCRMFRFVVFGINGLQMCLIA